MSKFVRLSVLFLSLVAFASPMVGCGSKEFADEGEGKEAVNDPMKMMGGATGMGTDPEKMKMTPATGTGTGTGTP